MHVHKGEINVFRFFNIKLTYSYIKIVTSSTNFILSSLITDSYVQEVQ